MSDIIIINDTTLCLYSCVYCMYKGSLIVINNVIVISSVIIVMAWP